MEPQALLFTPYKQHHLALTIGKVDKKLSIVFLPKVLIVFVKLSLQLFLEKCNLRSIQLLQ